MNKDWRSMERGQQIIIFVVYLLDILKDAGLIDGGKYSLSAAGVKIGQEMEKAIDDGSWDGPTPEEINTVLRALQSPIEEPVAPAKKNYTNETIH